MNLMNIYYLTCTNEKSDRPKLSYGHHEVHNQNYLHFIFGIKESNVQKHVQLVTSQKRRCGGKYNERLISDRTQLETTICHIKKFKTKKSKTLIDLIIMAAPVVPNHFS